MVVEDLDAEDRGRLGIDSGGVLVDRVEEGPGEKAGIRTGDVILSLDNQVVESAEQFKGLLDGIEAGRSVAVLIQRGDGRMFFPLRIPKE